MTNKINIVIPMAGAGSRFTDEGYQDPKPFIDVNGKMMIERVLDNLSYANASFYLIIRRDFLNCEKKRLDIIQRKYNVKFLIVNNLTDGAACTCLKAHSYINNDTPLLFANSDQIVDINVRDYTDDCLDGGHDGSILTFRSSSSKWSYASVSTDGFVDKVVEKEVISDMATVGLYFFSKGRYFIDGVMDMIANADKTKGEYYVAPVYNYCIKDDKRIVLYEIEESQMHGIGTPDDLDIYLNKIGNSNEN